MAELVAVASTYFGSTAAATTASSLGGAAAASAAASTAAAAGTAAGIGGALLSAETLFALGSGVSALSSLRAGQQQGKVAAQAAKQSMEAARVDERNQRRKASLYRSRQLAQAGVSGVNLTGSVADVIEQTAMEQEMDALAIRYGGRLGAIRAKSEGDIARETGMMGAISGAFQAGSTLLTGQMSNRRQSLGE